MQMTIKPIATAQTTYAIGAAAPERGGDQGRQPEDAAADRDVDDPGGQAKGADGARQGFAR